MSTRSGASYTAGGSDSNSPTPPVAETEVNNDPSLQHHHRQPAPFNGVGSGAPDLAGRGDPPGPDQDTPERGQAPPPRDPGPVARAPTLLRRQDDGVERLPSPVPDAGASPLDARGAPLSGAGTRPRYGPYYNHVDARSNYMIDLNPDMRRIPIQPLPHYNTPVGVGGGRE